jgi:C4-dicarboxylate-specific signal transduction histidine kinase
VRQGIEIHESHACPDALLADRHRIVQVLVNLLRNARDVLAGDDRRARWIEVDTALEGNVLRISVTDSGLGVPDEVRSKLFQYGFTTKEGGHGFGLHNGALMLAEAGGSLVCEPAVPGRGATFTLRLPVRRIGVAA